MNTKMLFFFRFCSFYEIKQNLDTQQLCAKKINKYKVFICHTTFGNLQGMKRSAASRHVHSLREYSTELNHQGRRF